MDGHMISLSMHTSKRKKIPSRIHNAYFFHKIVAMIMNTVTLTEKNLFGIFHERSYGKLGKIWFAKNSGKSKISELSCSQYGH